jgi:hypothetical protein
MRKQVFTAFAVEDKAKRDHLVYQAGLDHSPFDFVDMSVHQPWDEKWKTNCRARIKGCHGLVGLISKSTATATGQLWEIQCAYDEGIPVMLMWVNDDRPSIPKALEGKRINIWNWPNLKSFIEKL